jgi:hypothetical protein
VEILSVGLPAPQRLCATLVLSVALLVSSGAALVAHAALAEATENQLKAIFLIKFASYIQWPAAAFESPASPLNVCIVGRDSLGNDLDQAAAGEHVGARPVAVQHLKSLRGGAQCHIVYVAEPRLVADVIEASRGAPVLTVADDAADSAADRVIVRFMLSGDHLRFSIDDGAAAKNGLAISSKLLALAVSVRSKD